MSEKIQIEQSSRRGQFRLILNVTEDYSVGTICSPADLQSAIFKMKQAVNSEIKKTQLVSDMSVFLTDSEKDKFVELLSKIDDPQYINKLVSQIYDHADE